ncbi:DNA methyltransferase [Actinoplanes sp. NPDC024001]|uniref:TRM11 family SAM-dependent methyltransferase n=1 Tax=Actinoplanes sp. NPDC024001 TaxID=3154598 RepID=UPI0033FB63CE
MAEPRETLLIYRRSLAAQRRGRYVAGSSAHPDRMAPDLAGLLIRDYTQPGDLILDPFAGIGTTLVEAIDAGRDALGVEHDPGWVALSRANIAAARRRGATGRGRIVRGDATRLLACVPPALRGRITLILTAAPSGRTMPRRRRSRSDTAISHVDVADGLTATLTSCTRLLKPGGLIVLVSRPNQHDDTRVGAHLTVVDRRRAAHAVLRDGCLLPPHGTPPGSPIRYDDITVLTPARAAVAGRHG